MNPKYNYTDMHLHSKFSWDAQQTIDEIIKSAEKAGVLYAGVAEHIDFPADHRRPAAAFDFRGYSDAVEKAGKKFPGIRKGIEAGEPYLFKDAFEEFIKEKEIDYILGSVHRVGKLTPVYDSYFSAHDNYDKAYALYFEEVKKLVSYGNFDIAAHLNIVHRRGAEFNRDFTYEKFKTIIDEILKIMVDNNVGLEVNTSGLRYSAENILPDAEIIKAYMNFGGDIITVGSDAHTQDEIFFGLEKAFEILESLGAEHTAVFDKRKPVKIPLLKEGAPE